MTETDMETARCPECGMPLTMHHDIGCSQPCGRCAAALPPAGKFRVTIRIERPDGQFVTSERLIPDDLIAPGPDASVMQDWALREVGSAFVSAYHRAAELAPAVPLRRPGPGRGDEDQRAERAEDQHDRPGAGVPEAAG